MRKRGDGTAVFIYQGKQSTQISGIFKSLAITVADRRGASCSDVAPKAHKFAVVWHLGLKRMFSLVDVQESHLMSNV